MMPTFADILADALSEYRLEFARLPQHWSALLAMFVLLAMLYAVVWFYRREVRTGASAAGRVTMAVLRCLVIGVLAVIWVEPILATYIHRTIESYTLVLVDGSASMQLADRYADPAEAARVRRFLSGGRSAASQRAAATPQRRDALQEQLLFRDNKAWLKALAAKNRVQLWQYGDEPKRLGVYDATSQPASETGTQQHGWDTRQGRGTQPDPHSALRAPQSDAPVTDLGRTLREAVEELGASPIAGIVVVGDGGLNYGESAETIARYAKSRGIPIFSVGIGDPSPARNVRVAEVVAPANAFVKDPFTITVHISAQGFDAGVSPVERGESRAEGTATGPSSTLEGRGARFSVELVEPGDAGDRIVATETARVDPDGRVEPVTFRRREDQARTIRYVVRVPPLAGEAVTDDNARPFTVHILERKMRILLVAGSPGWDYQFVERLLERDQSVDVSCWLQSADIDAVRDGTTVITEFPRRSEQLMGYDVVVLFDPQPREFDPAWCDLAQTLVGSHGGGLLYAAGRKYTSRFMTDPACRGVVEMLPVTVEADAEIILNEIGYFQAQAWPVLIPPDAADHPVLAMADTPAESLSAWRRLTGVYWHYPVRRAKPLATVLMRHSNPRMANTYGPDVLLATQFFGAGRTGFLAFDSTWRWRRFGEEYFNRFWIQLLRHLMEGKLLGGGRRGILMTDRDTFAVGEPITLTARLLNENHMPLEASEVSAVATTEDGADVPVSLKAEPGRPGWFRGRLGPTRVGRLVFKAALPAASGAAAESLTHTVQVARPNLETLRPQMDRATLAAVAEHSAGGRYFDIDEADRIPDRIEDRNARIVITGTPVILWDRYRWVVLGAMMGLLTAEWILRKRARML